MAKLSENHYGHGRRAWIKKGGRLIKQPGYTDVIRRFWGQSNFPSDPLGLESPNYSPAANPLSGKRCKEILVTFVSVSCAVKSEVCGWGDVWSNTPGRSRHTPRPLTRGTKSLHTHSCFPMSVWWTFMQLVWRNPPLVARTPPPHTHTILRFLSSLSPSSSYRPNATSPRRDSCWRHYAKLCVRMWQRKR